MQFFYHLRDSVYNPAFYQGLLSKPFSSSLKYFFSLVILLSFILTLVFSLRVMPQLGSLLNDLGPKLISYYPEDLVVTVDEGEISINQPEPYAIPVPDELTGELSAATNLVVIDTTDSFALDLSNPYNTYLLITKNDAVFFDETGGIRVESLDNLPDAVIDRQHIASVWQGIAPYLRFALPIIVVGIFLALIIAGSMGLVYLLFGALLIWAITKFKGMNIGYKKSYQIGLHALTLGALVNILIILITPIGYIPFLFTLLMLSVAAMNVRPAVKRK